MIVKKIQHIFLLLLFVNILLHGAVKKEESQLGIAFNLIATMSETVHSLQQERGA